MLAAKIVHALILLSFILGQVTCGAELENIINSRIHFFFKVDWLLRKAVNSINII